MTRLSERLQAVEMRIAAACQRSGRPRSAVTLVAVTKAVNAALAQQLVDLGMRDLGENRPQELWSKAATLTGRPRWHLIGHLQRNKVARTLPLVEMIHSVDSLRLLQALEREAARLNLVIRVLLECNCSGEASKHGFAPAEIEGIARHLESCEHVHVCGLMTMAAYDVEAERCRPTFAMLGALRDALAPRLKLPHTMTELSMGMSNDFEVAIEEGATMIRLGTVLFEGLT
jgi:pyridoxal phosphate enzyme (YggS family)